MFTAPHQYVSVIGSAYNSTEKWQFGFRVTDGGATNDAVAFAIQPIVAGWWSGTSPFSATTSIGAVNTHNLTEIKVATIQPDGLYPPNSVSASYFYTPQPIGPQVPPTTLLPQSSIAVTLTTNVPRGLASKGRIYLPPSTRANIGADGRMSPANAQLVIDSMKLLLNSINALPEVGNISIMSRGKGVPSPPVLGKPPKYTYPNPGATAIVTGISMGRVVDTQRRRRRSLAENPVIAALP